MNNKQGFMTAIVQNTPIIPCLLSKYFRKHQDTMLDIFSMIVIDCDYDACVGVRKLYIINMHKPAVQCDQRQGTIYGLIVNWVACAL